MKENLGPVTYGGGEGSGCDRGTSLQPTPPGLLRAPGDAFAVSQQNEAGQVPDEQGLIRVADKQG